ncbi:hypothetical protein [Cellulomonas sp. URHE0023]|uniref:hypothetical protein n=1 Tax=Cellulomonas sp. URHE0023 TaxID=1380354 RepID=UPI0004887524|nr:hypothetical protein [Cellulomonas sp. URHE0023]
MEIEVDGERFSVTERGCGTYDASWLTGPNPGYGFSVSGRTHGEGVGYAARRLGDQELVDQIRSFLAQVDPVTGFME